MDLLMRLSEQFFEERPNFYSNNISSFSDFIKQKGIPDENLVTYLRGIRTDDIIESLSYYIESKNITSIETANRYMWAIKEYLYFMLHEGGISNAELLKEIESPTFKETSYPFKMRKAISDHSLKSKEGFGALSSEEVNELVTQCNELLTSEDQYLKAFEKQKYFNRYRSAILVKLMLLTGVAYRTIRKVKKSDLNVSHGIITINDYEIRLPKALQTNFQKYLELIDSLHGEQDDLFIEFNGNIMSVNTSTLFTFLSTFISRGDLNGIIKYSIINMIKAGMNETIIKKITGVEETILKDCQSNAFDKKTETRHFDSKIRSIEIYDML